MGSAAAIRLRGNGEHGVLQLPQEPGVEESGGGGGCGWMLLILLGNRLLYTLLSTGCDFRSGVRGPDTRFWSIHDLFPFFRISHLRRGSGGAASHRERRRAQ